ncbi:Putative 1-acyl-sn-glycerol-3-phosphate acyltransferase [Desulfonema limicola]|uniref:1-acyl-sn-glycerol-3-phosphate acyltransferase n=1 Tax=Desulfonema limicola TaxID=45656 RepID=A0A975GH84_9BACT|nr:lysophospholipid acyltransferase family protein [Desulfonema limicola]QTA80983.1 Putative 1-acyl-sn-glycerol-3-phosphate acyltransferase [Desulfonema limicola]
MKKILKLIYQPYKWLFFAPFFFISTFFFGTLAVLLCMIFDPRLPSFLCGSTWARLNGWLTPMFVKIIGKDNIDKNQSYIIAANHQSQYDIFLLYGWLGIDFKWVMKQELRKIPFIGISCEKIGHIFINRFDKKAAVAAINAAKKKIINGTSVIFFPEGTRSRTGELGSFKKGAFKMALDLELPILPVTIIGTRNILPPDTVDLFPGTAVMIIHKPVSVKDYNEDDLQTLSDKVRNIINMPLQESRT